MKKAICQSAGRGGEELYFSNNTLSGLRLYVKHRKMDV